MGVCNRYLLIWYSGPACCMYIDNECDCIVMCGYNVLAYLRAANFSSRCMKLFLAFCIFVLHIISWNGPRYDTLTHIHQFLGRPSRWTWIIQLSGSPREVHVTCLCTYLRLFRVILSIEITIKSFTSENTFF